MAHQTLYGNGGTGGTPAGRGPSTPASRVNGFDGEFDFIGLPPSSPWSTPASERSERRRQTLHNEHIQALKNLARLPEEELRKRGHPILPTPSTCTPKHWRGREWERRNMASGSSGYDGDNDGAKTAVPSRPPRVEEPEEDLMRWCVFNTEDSTERDFWSVINNRLTESVRAGIKRVQRVNQPNGHRRIDLWCVRSVGDALKEKLYMTSKSRRDGVQIDLSAPLSKIKGIWLPNNSKHAYTRKWRLTPHKSWQDRNMNRPKAPNVEVEKRYNIGTWNANGLKTKGDELERILDLGKLGLLAVQETLADGQKLKVISTDYMVYSKPSKVGFRGLSLLVHKSHMSYQVHPKEEDFIIHIKVGGMPGDKPWHVMGVYMPSGGLHRTTRSANWKGILAEYERIIAKDAEAIVVVLGDFNDPTPVINRRIKPTKTGLTILKTSTTNFTFHRKGTPEKDIDHIIVSPTAKRYLELARVEKAWLTTSDHWPLAADVTPPQETGFTTDNEGTKYRFDVEALRGEAMNFVLHNSWTTLACEQITTAEDLETAAEKFSSTTLEVGHDLEMLKPALGARRHQKRAIKRKINAARALKVRLDKEKLESTRNTEALEKLWKKARLAAAEAVKVDKKMAERKELQKAAAFVTEGNMGQFHKWNERYTKTGRAADPLQPVQKVDGSLALTKDEILSRFGEYFEKLLQDDPEGLSQNEEYWKGKATNRRKDILPGCDKKFEWKDVLIAIRHMAVGTASGHESVPPEVFKALLNVEILAANCPENVKRWLDNVSLAPPVDDLPNAPHTDMGRSLWRIIEAIWEKERPPTYWNKVVMTALFKSGDPTDLKNYRGISLVVLGLKVVTIMIAKKVSAGLEEAGLLCKEQGGFRPREEAIAQFVAFSEIIRRRRKAGSKTYVAFIDLEKAFDKVMHGALYEVLEAAGIRGTLLNLIKGIYNTSEFCVKAGGSCTGFFQLLRGTRQGCPLSPILFILFMNELVNHLPPGVPIPADRKKGSTKPTAEMLCQQLLFADDIAGFGETEEHIQAFLNGVNDWSKKWLMPVGIAKCNVLLMTNDEGEQEIFQTTANFTCGEKVVKTAKSYKYLGIKVTNLHGDENKTDEYAHANLLAERVKGATNVYRSYLRNDKFPLGLRLIVVNQRIVPLGLYGGEWLGMKKKLAEPIQRAVNCALKLCLGNSTKSRLFGDLSLGYEMGVDSIDMRMATARLRLWEKAPSLKTWLNELVTVEHVVDGSWTWVQMTKKMASGLKDTTELAFPDETELGRMEGKIDDSFMLTRSVALKVSYLHKARSARGLAKASALYFDRGFSYSRKYLETALSFPHLSKGVSWLTRFRLSAWHSNNRRADAAAREGRHHPYPKGTCPACSARLGLTDEVEHILLHCVAYDKERAQLRPSINLLRGLIDAEGEGAFMSEPYDKERVVNSEIVMRLLGGHIPKHRRETDAMGNPWAALSTPALPIRPNWPEGSDGLTYYNISWGGRVKTARTQNDVLKEYGFVPVARFLQEVMPQYIGLVFQHERAPRLSNYTSSEGDIPRWSASSQPQSAPSQLRRLDEVSGWSSPAAGRSRSVASSRFSEAERDTPCPPQRVRPGVSSKEVFKPTRQYGRPPNHPIG